MTSDDSVAYRTTITSADEATSIEVELNKEQVELLLALADRHVGENTHKQPPSISIWTVEA